MLMIGVLIIGVYAATQQQLTMQGSVSFNVPDKSLYVKDVRIKQDMASEPTSIDGFSPGYINGDFTLDLTGITDENTYGSFSLYFDIINTTDIQWTIKGVELPTALRDAGVSASYSGVIATNNLTDTDSDGYKNFDASTPIDGSLILTITAPNSSSVNLEGIVITIDEYIEPVVYVTSVTTQNASSQNTLTQFNGARGKIDLSGITFNTGETTLTISMTSLNANYIKNIVSYDSGAVDYNTTGTSGTLFVHSTSLYLPQNTSGELTSGESKDLTIYVNNNTGSPTTISGLQVSFEEKESLLQADTTNNYWYVEMGTVMGETESEYIRWKYIASVDDSSGSDVATKCSTFDANTAPTGEGYFYLETNVLSAIGRDGTDNMIEMPFNADYIKESGANPQYHHRQNGWENIAANDYSTSNVRQYINGNNAYDYYTGTSPSTGYIPSGRYSNMYSDYNIDPENDLVYKNIIGRNLGDLYSDMDGSSSGSSVTFPTFNEGVAIKYTERDSDKFWLLSYKEAYILLGSEDADRVWPSGSANSYWLRSPHYSNTGNASSVLTSGYLSYYYVYNNNHVAARAAFKFSISD